MKKTVEKQKMKSVPTLKYVHPALMVVLTFLTMGSYIGVWYLNRKDDLNRLTNKPSFNFGWWRFFTVGLFSFLFLQLFGRIIITEFGMDLIGTWDLIVTFFFIGLLYTTIFRLKDLLEEKKDIELNQYLLFFFHIFYIQFKVNQAANKN